MGYAQWIILNIINNLRTQNIQVKNPQLSYGKFHEVGDNDREISSSEISDMRILAGGWGQIASCGREHSPTGTEGSIDLYHAGTKICTVYWDCPWSGHNTLNAQGPEDYLCTLGSWNQDSGAIGKVDVTVSRGPSIDVGLGVNIGG